MRVPADGAPGSGQNLAPPAPLPERGPAPERSPGQRLEALKKANRIRTHRAGLKRDLAARRLSIEALLDGADPDVATMKIFDALLAVPKFGRVKVNKLLLTAQISPSKTLGGLTERQRKSLSYALTGHAPEPRRPHRRSATAAGITRLRAAGLDDLVEDIRRA